MAKAKIKMTKFTGNLPEYIVWEAKRQKRIAKKQAIINSVIENLKENLYDSQEYIFDLVEESLLKRTNKELLEINN